MLAAFSERQCLTPSHLSVSSSRSSNRACRFPALGLQTRSCIHPRKARPRLHKANQTVGVIQILIREIYRFPALRLVFPLLTPIPLIVGEEACASEAILPVETTIAAPDQIGVTRKCRSRLLRALATKLSPLGQRHSGLSISPASKKQRCWSTVGPNGSKVPRNSERQCA